MIIFSLVWEGGNDGCDERGNTGLGREKCIALLPFLFFFLFRRINVLDSITGPSSNVKPYYTPVFQERFIT